MFKLTKKEIIDKADKLSFNKPPLEKVLRLVEILDFLNSDSTTKRKLALKGGTAINFSVLQLP